MRKVRPRFNSHYVISRAVREALAPGIRKYYKYRDEEEPHDMDAAVTILFDEIMLKLSEVVEFGDE